MKIVLFISSLVLIVVICLTVLYSRRRVKEKGTKLGCSGTVNVFALILVSTSFSFGFSFTLGLQIKEKVEIIYSGEKYYATVVDYVATTGSYDEDKRAYSTEYIPVVEFKPRYKETIQKELDYSSNSVPVLGERYSVYYDTDADRVAVVGWAAILKLFVAVLIVGAIDYVFIGLLLYCIGRSIANYKARGIYVGLYYVLPGVLVLFMLGLIYGLFNGEDKPTWVYFTLLLSIFGLGLGLWAFIKTMWSGDKGDNQTI